MPLLSPTNPYWARVVGYAPFSLCVVHKEGLCPSSGDINGLMMMMMVYFGIKLGGMNVCIICIYTYKFKDLFYHLPSTIRCYLPNNFKNRAKFVCNLILSVT
jgi:hypothetical protein